jgi:hypothetical protein
MSVVPNGMGTAAFTNVASIRAAAYNAELTSGFIGRMSAASVAGVGVFPIALIAFMPNIIGAPKLVN